MMDGLPPSGSSACNKYPCSCLTSLTYQTHLSLLGHPRGTHNYKLRCCEGVGIVVFIGPSPRAKTPKKQIAVNNVFTARRILLHSLTFHTGSHPPSCICSVSTAWAQHSVYLHSRATLDFHQKPKADCTEHFIMLLYCVHT